MDNDKKIREISIPGETLGSVKTFKTGYGTYIEGDKIFSKFVGILQKKGEHISVIPLSGIYVPQRNDKIIGIVEDVQKYGWIININSAWDGFLPTSEGTTDYIDVKTVDMRKYFDVGDVIYTRVTGHKRGDVQLTMKDPMARKLNNGVVVKIVPSKVPRLIGKKGSMVNLIKDKTGTIIRVGQNGLVWVSGDEMNKAIKAIKTVEEKSHIYGLTDEISKLLS